MNETKQELTVHSVLFVIGGVIGAGYYWLFDWAWWTALPLGIVSVYLFCAVLVALTLIYWGIVGD